MTPTMDKKKTTTNLRTYWGVIITTVGLCSAVWFFFHTRILDIKNAEIALLNTQIRIFETKIRVLKDEIIEEKDKIIDKISKAKPVVKPPDKNGGVRKDFKLHKNEIYQFPFNENCSFRITEIDNLKDVKVEFNLKGIIKSESLQINKSTLFSIEDKEYNFLLKGISEVDGELVPEFSVVIKNID